MIEDLKVGQRVVTFTDDEDSIRDEHFEGYAVNEEVISEETHRLIRLVVLGESNDNVDSLEDGGIATLVATSTVELLRDLDWIEAQGASVGETIELDMPEMSICGPAEVFAIEACPEIEVGEGQVVTATFHHQSGDVFDLQLEGESETIGVTGTHPFWSLDRSEWKSAGQLEIGERLKTLDGATAVEAIDKRQVSTPVYNIEVGTDHVYRVGDAAVLVHDDSEKRLGRVRNQVQDSQSGRTLNTESDLVEANEGSCGVTVRQVQSSLKTLNTKVENSDWYPNNQLAPLGSAIVKASRFLNTIPPNGVSGTIAITREEWPGGKRNLEYRLDIENLNGDNLSQTK